jgi:hypothetical protein
VLWNVATAGTNQAIRLTLPGTGSIGNSTMPTVLFDVPLALITAVSIPRTQGAIVKQTITFVAQKDATRGFPGEAFLSNCQTTAYWFAGIVTLKCLIAARILACDGHSNGVEGASARRPGTLRHGEDRGPTMTQVSSPGHLFTTPEFDRWWEAQGRGKGLRIGSDLDAARSLAWDAWRAGRERLSEATSYHRLQPARQ